MHASILRNRTESHTNQLRMALECPIIPQNPLAIRKDNEQAAQEKLPHVA